MYKKKLSPPWNRQIYGRASTSCMRTTQTSCLEVSAMELQFLLRKTTEALDLAYTIELADTFKTVQMHHDI